MEREYDRYGYKSFTTGFQRAKCKPLILAKNQDVIDIDIKLWKKMKFEVPKPRRAKTCLWEMNYVTRYDVVKSDILYFASRVILSNCVFATPCTLKYVIKHQNTRVSQITEPYLITF